MRIFFGLCFAAALVWIFVAEYRRTKDFFSPLCFFAFMQCLRYVPHFLYTDWEHFIELNVKTLQRTYLVEGMYIIAVLLGCCGLRWLLRRRKIDLTRAKKEPRPVQVPLWLILVVYGVGLASRLYLLRSIGGLFYVLHNMGNAYFLYAHFSSGYVGALGHLMTLAVVMLIHKYSQEKKRGYLFLGAGMMVLAMGTYLIYSSRSPAMELVMIAVFAWHYLCGRIALKKIFRPRVIAVGVALLAVVVVLPSLRNDSREQRMEYSEFNVVQRLGEGFEDVFNDFSYVGRDTFVYHYFPDHGYWLGRNFLNLLVAPIPSSMYPNKPCVDDGNYLCNIMRGYDTTPDMGRDELTVDYSVPFSTQGCMFANFGYAGVVVAGLLLGVFYAWIYCLHLRWRTVFSVIAYQLAVYQLELSTLSIVQTVVPLILTAAIWFLCTRCFVKKAE